MAVTLIGIATGAPSGSAYRETVRTRSEQGPSARRAVGRGTASTATRGGARLRRGSAPRARRPWHGRRLPRVRVADGALRALPRIHVLSRRALPASRLPRLERPDARVRRAVGRPADPVPAPRPERGAARGGAALPRARRARD